MVNKNQKGITVIEALVCMVIIGIGFVAMMQLSAYSIGAMDRSIEKNKMNFLSEMVLEDMIGDPYNASSYANISMGCTYSSSQATSLPTRKINKWKKVFSEDDFIKFNSGSGFKDKKPECASGDQKKTSVVSSSGRTQAKINMSTGKGKRKKFLGVILK